MGKLLTLKKLPIDVSVSFCNLLSDMLSIGTVFVFVCPLSISGSLIFTEMKRKNLRKIKKKKKKNCKKKYKSYNTQTKKGTYPTQQRTSPTTISSQEFQLIVCLPSVQSAAHSFTHSNFWFTL